MKMFQNIQCKNVQNNLNASNTTLLSMFVMPLIPAQQVAVGLYLINVSLVPSVYACHTLTLRIQD